MAAVRLAGDSTSHLTRRVFVLYEDDFFTLWKENCSHEKADPHINLKFTVSFFVEDSVSLQPVDEKSSTFDQSKTMDKVWPIVVDICESP
jgi:hypothetical protein